jgi:hypothetical protein
MVFDVRKAFTAAAAGSEDGARREALLVAELALWSAMTDGRLGDDEVGAVAKVLGGIPALGGFGVADARRLIAEISDRYRSEDAIAARIEEVALGIESYALQRVAYALAALCATSDRTCSDDEAGFLGGLQSLWHIPDDEAEALVRQALG